MKVILILICVFVVYPINAKIIKVAILDNPSPKWTSAKYVEYYMNGLQTEVSNAQIESIQYELKIFKYSEPAINILKTINNIQKWHADLVIGPRVSEHFLLLKNQFKDILVLSPYASAEEVYHLPANFYTLAVSAQFSSKIITKYLSSKANHVYIFTNVDCKTCNDYGYWLKKYLLNYGIEVTSIDFIDSNIINNSINYQIILNKLNIKQNLLVLNCTGYSAGLLISKISNTMRLNGITYIGTDSWGTYKDWDIGKIPVNYSYNALRITPKAINPNNLIIKKFNKDYVDLFGDEPDAISYITYNTLNSVTDALIKYNCNIKNIKINLLCSYKNAVSHNTQWHRPIIHELYNMKKDNEYFLMDIQ